MTGTVVLIRRGACGFHEKARNAQTAGAAGVILYNNTTGTISPTVAGPVAITIPVVAITAADGATVNNRIAAGPTSMTFTPDVVSIPNATGNLSSSFSSYGLSPDLALKPDIGAQGGLIRSTYPLELGSYATISGASMSSPHVAGAVALLLEAKPDTNANSVRTILQNSADPKLWWGNPGAGADRQRPPPWAGMLDVDEAILATSTVTVPAGGSASFDVTISPNAALPDRGVYGGYVVLTPQGGGQNYRVPFAGFKGDYHGFQVLTPLSDGFPKMAKQSGWVSAADFTPTHTFAAAPVYTMQASAPVFGRSSDDVPTVAVYLDHHASRLRAEVFRASDGNRVGEAFDIRYLPRNAAATGIARYFALAWEGKVKKGNTMVDVADGDYYIALTLVRPLGSESNPAHVESATLGNFTIDRP